MRARHDDICQQQIDRSSRSQNFTRGFSAWRSYDPIIEAAQNIRQIGSQIGIIFYQQYAFGFLGADHHLVRFIRFITGTSN